MLTIIKSGPDTSEGRRALKLARDMSSDIVLLQNGVYFALREQLDGFCGTACAVEEDVNLRGLREEELERGLKLIDWDELIELMAEEEEKVVGAF